MRRVPPGAALVVLLVAVCRTSAHGLIQEDALGLIQTAALGGGAQRQAFSIVGPQQATFEAGQTVEVNVFGSKWVNASVIGPGAKSDTYRIHVPSFPSGHQDLPDVKVASLRDPKAEEKRLALKAQEAARRKADEEARRKAEELERKAAEAEERRVAEIQAHTFEPGELVEVKSTAKSGNTTWVKAVITGKGSQPHKYNISVGNVPIANINYLALRKDAAYHFEVGEHAEVKAKTGKLQWVKCIITGKGDKPSTYNINIPAAQKHKQDLLNIPARSLRKEPIPIWTPKFEIGQLMEVNITNEKNKSTWIRCNVTGKALKVETYHLQVLTNATGYPLENVSAVQLRETEEGHRLLREKRGREKALEEEKKRAEKERLKKEEEAAIRKRYHMRKQQEVEDEKKLEEELQKREKEKAKKDPFTFLKLQAQKSIDRMVDKQKAQRLKMEQQLKRQEEQQKERMETLKKQIEEAFETKDSEEQDQKAQAEAVEGVVRAREEDAKNQTTAWEQYVQSERKRKMEADQRTLQLFVKSRQQQQDDTQIDVEAQREKMVEARKNAERERLKTKQQDEKLRRRSEARKALKRALLGHGDKGLMAALRPAIEEANRTGVELEAMVEPCRTLSGALWNTTVAKLRQAVPRRGVMELAKVLLESQAMGLEMTRLQKFIELGEAEQRGEEVNASSVPRPEAAARALEAAGGVPSSLSRAALEEALSRNYTVKLLEGIPEFAEAEKIFRYEGSKWAAYLHMKDAERLEKVDDLRAALREGEAANVTEVLVREGHAIADLLEATNTQDLWQLRTAIAGAEDFGVFCHRLNFVSNNTAILLERAKKLLVQEAAREPARLALQSAVKARDVEQLAKALRDGEHAKLKRQELAEGRQLRDQILRESKAEREQQKLEEAKQRKAKAEAAKESQLSAWTGLKAKIQRDRENKTKKAAEKSAADAKDRKAEGKAARERKIAERRARAARDGKAASERKKMDVEEFRARRAREEEEWRQKQQEDLQRATQKSYVKLKAKVAATKARKMRLDAKVRASEKKTQKSWLPRGRRDAEQNERAEAEHKAEAEPEQLHKLKEEEEEGQQRKQLQSAAEWDAKDDVMGGTQQEAAGLLEPSESRRDPKEEKDGKVQEPETQEAEEETLRRSRLEESGQKVQIEEERKAAVEREQQHREREEQEGRAKEDAARLDQERKAQEEKIRPQSAAELREKEDAAEKTHQEDARPKQIEAMPTGKEDEDGSESAR